MNDDKRFAVLIDADNVSDKYIKHILDEMTNYGLITYKRIYGDWTKPALGAWKTVLLDNSITPIQQYGYTIGKNATDSAMIIDAMDILYSKNVEGFCIVSSDSDFTRLASRLRESGMFVVGMGEKKTPSAFVAACNQFKYLEILVQSNEPEIIATVSTGSTNKTDNKELIDESMTPLSILIKAISSIINDTSDDDGWCPLSDVGNILTKRFPDFDVRNYGYNKLTPLVRSLHNYEIKSERKNNQRLIYIKINEKK
ncbi:MAG: Maebl [Clostridiales bacterium GWF2_38_85]|nr:MAG: Maebl [Clostridiales bacterium GWF2_38_85]HBL83764.1 Maebl [Clostridiales bacterium]